MDMLNFYERPFRAKLIPSKVWKDLDRYKNDPKGLSNYFRKWRTKVEWRPQTSKAKVYKQYIGVGGEYDPNDRQCIIQIYTTHFSTFHFDDDTWDRFKYKLIQTLTHELIHFMQYDRRYDESSNYVVPYKTVGKAIKDAERRYLSEFDEIQAYAHCVLLDFKTRKPNIPLETLITRAKKKCDSPTLKYYLKTFDNDFRNNVAIPMLLRHVAKWDRKYERVIRASRRPK